MKAIMMSIRPQYVAKILNKEKTIEVRKKFPVDYVGWVYIYVTQNHKHAGWKNRDTLKRDSHDGKPTNHFQLWTDDMVEDKDKLNGKVVARFWCDKVEGIEPFYDDSDGWYIGYISEKTFNQELFKKSCLTEKEIDNYLKRKNGVGIHITSLEIFDEPKEIKEFHWYRKQWVDCGLDCPPYVDEVKHALTRAPQSWGYIEI